MFNISNYQRNANENHNEISPHTCQNGYRKPTNNKCWQVYGEKRTFVYCWWECKFYIFTHAMEYYSTIKKNEILPFSASWIDIDNIILNEVSQTEKEKYMISLIYGI